MNFSILSKALALSNRGLVPAIRHFGQIEQIFTAHPDDLAEWFAQKDVARIRQWYQSGDLPKNYSDIERSLDAEEATILSLCAPNYPTLLAEIPDPPAVLFIKGEPETLNQPQIAVVGSRNCTAQGRRLAHDFSLELSAAGFCITSGLALGIDTAAHKGSLTSGGQTCAVMGTGLDMIYPARNKALAKEIIDKRGALVTEFIPGSPPRGQHFPQRNRIVTGLCLGVLVIEAGERSGSLISARLAAEQGREVFAIPGSLLSPVSAGCNRLIREGATLVAEPAQVVEQLGPMLGFHIEMQDKPALTETGISAGTNEQKDHWLIKKMGFDPISADELCQLCECTSSEVTAALAELELSGVVTQTSFGYQRLF